METIERPNILSYIAGRKNGISLVKVFLERDDKGTEDFFRDKCSLENVEFENISELFRSMPMNTRETLINDSLMKQEDREKLGILIKTHREKLMAMHSNIVALGVGTKMVKENERVPCIVIQCLDKSLIPFGEQPLPMSIDGFLVDIRENFVLFGCCLNCSSLKSGCAIGRRSSNFAGSVGFIVRSKHHSNFQQHGFLTAAHVVIEKFYELYSRNNLLSKDILNETRHEIVHPPMTDRVVGNVAESFCGNYGHQCIGMDAAFVTVNDEKLREGLVEASVVKENELRYDKCWHVKKTGTTTNETEGILLDGSLVVRITQGMPQGAFCEFYDCFEIGHLGPPFFSAGDSGSGVFLIDEKDGNRLKALGIAFAQLGTSTAVCRIGHILDAFDVAIYHKAEPMDVDL